MILSLNFHNLMLAFLREPKSRAVIVCSIRFEKPPLAGLTDLMNPRFPALTDGEKATTGKLVRVVAEELGFHHQHYDVAINTPGCQFTKGSTYSDAPRALQIAV